MSYQVPYHRSPAYRVPNSLIPGNESADNAVEFDLLQAWGGDLARIRSIITASVGLVHDLEWTPRVQEAIIASFETGALVFINTVEAIRGLTIPAEMALRAGIIPTLPIKPGTTTPDHGMAVPVTTGMQFSKVCGAPGLAPMALAVAMRIAEISKATDALDPRFFVQPSGSGGTGTPRTPASTAGRVQGKSRRRATAASGGGTAE